MHQPSLNVVTIPNAVIGHLMRNTVIQARKHMIWTVLKEPAVVKLSLMLVEEPFNFLGIITMACLQSKYYKRFPHEIAENFTQNGQNDNSKFRFLEALGIRDENGEPLDLISNPNLVITHQSPPLAILGSMWFYMTASNGYPSMHSVIIGDWDGYGKWTGAVFGPSSKIINNECGGESRTEGDIGGYESRNLFNKSGVMFRMVQF